MNIKYFFGQFPVLDLGSIVLRRMTEDDASHYMAYMNCPEMHDVLTKDNMPASLAKAKEEMKYWSGLFDSKRSLYWAIAWKETDQIIGSIGFNHISFPHSRAEISYDLDPEYWGKGLMLKAINGVLKFADGGLELVRIQGTVLISNERSIKVLDRCGFKREGVLKKYEIVAGEYRDYYMYARVVE